MLLRRCDRPLLLATTRCAIDLAEVRGWSAATITGVFYGLKAVLDGHTGEDLVLLSEVRQQVRPRSHSSATRVTEVLAELELLHDDTTAPIRSWIDRRVGELPTGFGRDVRAWLVMLLDGDARTRPRSPTTLRVNIDHTTAMAYASAARNLLSSPAERAPSRRPKLIRENHGQRSWHLRQVISRMRAERRAGSSWQPRRRLVWGWWH